MKPFVEKYIIFFNRGRLWPIFIANRIERDMLKEQQKQKNRNSSSFGPKCSAVRTVFRMRMIKKEKYFFWLAMMTWWQRGWGGWERKRYDAGLSFGLITRSTQWCYGHQRKENPKENIEDSVTNLTITNWNWLIIIYHQKNWVEGKKQKERSGSRSFGEITPTSAASRTTVGSCNVEHDDDDDQHDDQHHHVWTQFSFPFFLLRSQ